MHQLGCPATPIGDDGFSLRLLPPVMLLQGPSGASPGCLNDGCTAIDLLLSFHPGLSPSAQEARRCGRKTQTLCDVFVLL